MKLNSIKPFVLLLVLGLLPALGALQVDQGLVQRVVELENNVRLLTEVIKVSKNNQGKVTYAEVQGDLTIKGNLSVNNAAFTIKKDELDSIKSVNGKLDDLIEKTRNISVDVDNNQRTNIRAGDYLYRFSPDGFAFADKISNGDLIRHDYMTNKAK